MALQDVVDRWHRYVQGEDPGALEELLAEDVVFYSPVVFTPQRGKAVTTLYLSAAAQAFPAEGTFRYTKQVLAGDVAVLEFETTIEGKHVNGVDILRVDGDAIVEFRVMVRPLQAVQVVHAQMQALLASMTA
jgi:ketosteroid isomerase-like protein